MCLGIPGRIVDIVDAPEQRAIADVDGVRREISVSLLGVEGDEEVHTVGDVSGDDAVDLDDWVLIHVGFAMSKIDEAEADETLRALKKFGETYEQEIDEFRAAGPMDPASGDPLDPLAGTALAGAGAS